MALSQAEVRWDSNRTSGNERQTGKGRGVEARSRSRVAGTGEQTGEAPLSMETGTRTTGVRNRPVALHKAAVVAWTLRPALDKRGAAGASCGGGLAGSGRGWRGSGLGGQVRRAPLSSAQCLPGGRNGGRSTGVREAGVSFLITG